MGLDISHVIPSLETSEDKFLEYFTVQELRAFPNYIQQHNNLFVDKEDENGKLRVIFFKEIGFQRKGMNSNFYKDFENGKLYLDIETVRIAYKYLQADHINSLEELQQNFQKKFIDNFIEGESIFYISW